MTKNYNYLAEADFYLKVLHEITKGRINESTYPVNKDIIIAHTTTILTYLYAEKTIKLLKTNLPKNIQTIEYIDQIKL